MKAQTVEIRFGIVAIDKGFITCEQLIDALRIQVRGEIEQGEHKLIGTIFIEMGLLTRQQIDEIVKELLNRRES
ncbi:MAG: hypothetical protein JW882_19685 [Deltaproteobacteria bacterium]|nr:hypothetical protein [Deltaproteobacteria bacterium]